MIIKTTEFEGTMYKDSEEIVFAVTEDSFMNIYYDFPQEYDKSRKYEGLYDLYFEDLLPELEKGKMYKFEVTIKVIPIDEGKEKGD